jgi:hypothetical protein
MIVPSVLTPWAYHQQAFDTQSFYRSKNAILMALRIRSPISLTGEAGGNANANVRWRVCV